MARHLCTSKTALPLHVKFWPLKLFLTWKSNPSLRNFYLFVPILIPWHSPDNKSKANIWQSSKYAVTNHSAASLLLFNQNRTLWVDFFLLCPCKWAHAVFPLTDKKTITALNSLFLAPVANQPLSAVYFISCKALRLFSTRIVQGLKSGLPGFESTTWRLDWVTLASTTLSVKWREW